MLTIIVLHIYRHSLKACILRNVFFYGFECNRNATVPWITEIGVAMAVFEINALTKPVRKCVA